MRKYKTNNEFVLQFDKEKVTIFDPVNSHLYTLNKTASLIFNSLNKGLSIEQISQQLFEEYAINLVDAEKEVLETLDYFLKEEIIK